MKNAFFSHRKHSKAQKNVVFSYGSTMKNAVFSHRKHRKAQNNAFFSLTEGTEGQRRM